MNKTGNLGWEAIAAMVMVGLIIVISIGLLRPTTSEAGTFFSSEVLKIKDSKCLYEKEQADRKGVIVIDSDKDGRPDACDVCPSGLNTEDKDLDGMPAQCDKDDNDRTITACKGTVTKDGRCMTT